MSCITCMCKLCKIARGDGQAKQLSFTWPGPAVLYMQRISCTTGPCNIAWLHAGRQPDLAHWSMYAAQCAIYRHKPQEHLSGITAHTQHINAVLRASAEAGHLLCRRRHAAAATHGAHHARAVLVHHLHHVAGLRHHQALLDLRSSTRPAVRAHCCTAGWLSCVPVHARHCTHDHLGAHRAQCAPPQCHGASGRAHLPPSGPAATAGPSWTAQSMILRGTSTSTSVKSNKHSQARSSGGLLTRGTRLQDMLHMSCPLMEQTIKGRPYTC